MTTLARASAALFFALAASSGMAADWRYSLGIHDFSVPDVDSQTWGLNGSVSVDQRTDSGQHYFGSFELFWDHDKDHLDPDHIPIWWQLHLGSDGDFWRDDRMRLGWTANIDTRMNTVSSIERQITALPAFVAGYDGPVFQASVEAGAGWFFLEIDDDAPRERGYDRTNLRNETFAYAATAKLAVKLGESWTLSGRARHWWDNDQTLETQYQAALRVDASSWMGGFSVKQPALVLSADYYKYNLDVYSDPNRPPVLSGNNDLMIRLAFEAKW
ncbi:MAG TPA: hypothetical protein VHQ87_04480 [Rhizobacter sp.]|jgi:hypothetical protein|nr:hypothetical protein [Rhizobacter sp.]